MKLTSKKTRWVAVGATVAALGGGGAALALNGGSDGSQDLKPGASSVTVPNEPDSRESQDATEATEASGAEGREDPKTEAKDDAAETAEAAQLAKVAKVTEAQAKAAAIARVPGTADTARLGNENGNVVWEVEVTDGAGKVQEIKVDAGNARVLLVEAGD